MNVINATRKCYQIGFRIKDEIIYDVEFVGGCAGNLIGISSLVKGQTISDVISKLQGIPCGSRPTSCPDQLTRGLDAYLKAKSTVNA